MLKVRDIMSAPVITAGAVRFPMDLPVLTAMVWQLPGFADVAIEAPAREPDPDVSVL